MNYRVNRVILTLKMQYYLDHSTVIAVDKTIRIDLGTIPIKPQ